MVLLHRTHVWQSDFGTGGYPDCPHLQGLEKEVPEALDGTKQLFQGEPGYILTQVQSQSHPLLLYGSKAVLQSLASFQIALQHNHYY